MHAAYKDLKMNLFGKKTNSRKLHMYGEKCYENAENPGLFTHIHVVFFNVLLCAHILTITCATKELKCKLLILFCSGKRGRERREIVWKSECEIRFESFPTSHGSTINLGEDCSMEMSQILLLSSFLPFYFTL